MTPVRHAHVSERVLTVLHTLNTQQLGDVLLCMEFLNTKAQHAVKDDPFWLAITREANPNVT